MLNKHGYKMVGLKTASGNTANWAPGSGGHTQISYDRATGEIFTDDHIGQSWSVYHDSSVITVCHTDTHMTMQQIADAIRDCMTHIDEEAMYQ